MSNTDEQKQHFVTNGLAWCPISKHIEFLLRQEIFSEESKHIKIANFKNYKYSEKRN